MTKPTHHLGMKVAACFLVILTGLTALFSGIGVILAGECGFYGGKPLSYYETSLCQSTSYDYADRLMSWLNSDPDWDWITEAMDPSKTNFRYEVIGPDGELLLASADLDGAVAVGEYGFSLYYGYYETSGIEEDADVSVTYYDEPVHATVRAYVADPLVASDNYWISYRGYGLLSSLRVAMIPLLLASLLVFAAALIYLCCAAGHRDGKDEITPNTQDKLPLDLYGGVWLALMASLSIATSHLTVFSVADLMLLLAGILTMGILSLALLLTLATRFKLGKWWKNTITYWVLLLCRKAISAIFGVCADALRAVPAMWKVAVTWLVVSSVYLRAGFGAVLLNMALTIVFCSIASQMQRLQRGGEELVKGNLNYKVDTGRMFSFFRRHGENLNSISKGFSIALNQKMKSERLKTELITNVSHDVKTPLTSIINYVDLLKKEPLSGQAAEYLEVLDRQSRRLKKLTEDLVEASKASTGNLKVDLAPTDMGELVAQAVAEYEEKLAAANLEAVINGGETPLYAMVDGNLTWRVLSNLLSNACKYSMPHTRVYLDLKQIGNTVLISAKNISRVPLNIPADELMERFVRGDSSRSTEGSGLGLNIAQSLVGLQKGKFSLEIEGDLFKAYIRFPAAEPPAAPQPEEPQEAPEPLTPEEPQA